MTGTRVAPRWWIALSAVLAVVLLGCGFAGLARDRGGDVVRTTADVSGIPVTVVRPPTPGPGLIVAHGFSGSSAIMDGLATSWARAGFAVAMLDFAGHGRNPNPQAPGTGVLVGEIDTVAAWLRAQSFVTDAPLQLVGHSMGAGAAVAAAVADPRFAGTVAISLPSADDVPAGQPATPANLLLLWGAAEQPRFGETALAALHAAYPDGRPGVIYGTQADGTARQAREVPASEHLSILWRTDTAQWAYDWLSGPAGLPAAEVRLAPRMAYFAAVALGALLALIPLSTVLLGNRRPTIPRPLSALRAGAIMVAAAAAASLVAAVGAPLTDATPLAVGGHLALWFSGGAVALLPGAVISGQRPGRPAPLSIGAAVALTGFITLSVTAAGRLAWTATALVGPRTWLFLLFSVILLAWFTGDELLVRREARARRAGLLILSRAVLMVFLLGGVVFLNAPWFLVLLVPLLVPLLTLLGAAAWVVGARTTSALVPASVQAVPLALLVATAFPLVVP